jgi:hypothetical protein
VNGAAGHYDGKITQATYPNESFLDSKT